MGPTASSQRPWLRATRAKIRIIGLDLTANAAVPRAGQNRNYGGSLPARIFSLPTLPLTTARESLSSGV
jgi:hypothetical protein